MALAEGVERVANGVAPSSLASGTETGGVLNYATISPWHRNARRATCYNGIMTDPLGFLSYHDENYHQPNGGQKRRRPRNFRCLVHGNARL